MPPHQRVLRNASRPQRGGISVGMNVHVAECDGAQVCPASSACRAVGVADIGHD